MDFEEEIKNRRRTNFKVTNIPVWALKEFKALCEEEYGDVYFVGIIQLMKVKKHYEEMISHFDSLQKQIDELKSIKSKVKLNTFGGKDV